jgi:hypothetical protein
LFFNWFFLWSSFFFFRPDLVVRYYLGPPDADQRFGILQKVLSEETVEESLVQRVAEVTERYCGSDLLELCKVAVLNRLRQGEDTPFCFKHFEDAMKCVRFVGASAEEQERRDLQHQVDRGTAAIKVLKTRLSFCFSFLCPLEFTWCKIGPEEMTLMKNELFDFVNKLFRFCCLQ